MEPARLKRLISAYNKGMLTAGEITELNDWFHSLQLDEATLEGTTLDTWIKEAGGKEQLADILFTDFSEKLRSQQLAAKPFVAPDERTVLLASQPGTPITALRNEETSRRRTGWWVAAAACILFCISTGAWLWLRPSSTTTIAKTRPIAPQDITPGGDKAILTLANGKQIVLPATGAGQLATQGNTIVQHVNGGGVIYKPDEKSSRSAEIILYNTLSTPRGGQHMLTLSDGSKVWLNAASSIKFPVDFSGSDRVVEVTGEAYFEVLRDKNKPFKVKVGNEIIEDLGTRFNINAYDDEQTIRTTLAEGCVRVLTPDQSVVLSPGQQSMQYNTAAGPSLHVVKADTAVALAWKNGLFKFHGADLGEVMRQLARWYNVTIRMDGPMPERRFSGEITRDVNIAQVFEILNYMKISFRTEQNGQQTTIIVVSKE